jgi:poly-gamma-glutamate synthesis protein (capsule biosynthesis protein)
MAPQAGAIAAVADGHTLHVLIEDGAPEPASQTIEEYLQRHAPATRMEVISRQAGATAGVSITPADLLITRRRQTAPNAVSVPLRYWVPVTGFTHDIQGISYEALRRALVSGPPDWRTISGEATPLRIVVPEELAGRLPELLDLTAAETAALAQREVAPANAIMEMGASEQGLLSLLPLDSLSPRVRSLALDGSDPLRNPAGLADYPLASRLWIVPRERSPLLDGLVEHLSGALAAVPPNAIRILATGDIIPARCAYARIRAIGDFRSPFLRVGDMLRSADLTLGSVDAALSDKGQPFACEPTFSLLAPAASIEGLSFAGFDLVTTAGNHAKDCGRSPCGNESLLDMQSNLQRAGITHVGSGRNLVEARSPAVLEAKGIRFAFLGYDDIASQYYGATQDSPGTAPLSHEAVSQDVQRAQAMADVVIVMPHWGNEYTPNPTERQRSIARTAAQAGATLVIGNHPHVVQATEFAAGTFVAYALGNFVFDQDWSVPTQEGVIMEAVFHGRRLAGVRFLPIKIEDQHQPRLLSPDEGRHILQRIYDATARLSR